MYAGCYSKLLAQPMALFKKALQNWHSASLNWFATAQSELETESSEAGPCVCWSPAVAFTRIQCAAPTSRADEQKKTPRKTAERHGWQAEKQGQDQPPQKMLSKLPFQEQHPHRT